MDISKLDTCQLPKKPTPNSQRRAFGKLVFWELVFFGSWELISFYCLATDLFVVSSQLLRPARADRDVRHGDVRAGGPAAGERRGADRRRLQLSEWPVFPREARLRARVCAAGGSAVGDLGRGRLHHHA